MELRPREASTALSLKKQLQQATSVLQLLPATMQTALSAPLPQGLPAPQNAQSQAAIPTHPPTQAHPATPTAAATAPSKKN